MAIPAQFQQYLSDPEYEVVKDEQGRITQIRKKPVTIGGGGDESEHSYSPHVMIVGEKGGIKEQHYGTYEHKQPGYTIHKSYVTKQAEYDPSGLQTGQSTERTWQEGESSPDVMQVKEYSQGQYVKGSRKAWTSAGGKTKTGPRGRDEAYYKSRRDFQKNPLYQDPRTGKTYRTREDLRKASDYTGGRPIPVGEAERYKAPSIAQQREQLRGEFDRVGYAGDIFTKQEEFREKRVAEEIRAAAKVKAPQEPPSPVPLDEFASVSSFAEQKELQRKQREYEKYKHEKETKETLGILERGGEKMTSWIGGFTSKIPFIGDAASKAKEAEAEAALRVESKAFWDMRQDVKKYKDVMAIQSETFLKKRAKSRQEQAQKQLDFQTTKIQSLVRTGQISAEEGHKQLRNLYDDAIDKLNIDTRTDYTDVSKGVNVSLQETTKPFVEEYKTKVTTMFEPEFVKKETTKAPFESKYRMESQPVYKRLPSAVEEREIKLGVTPTQRAARGVEAGVSGFPAIWTTGLATTAIKLTNEPIKFAKETGIGISRGITQRPIETFATVGTTALLSYGITKGVGKIRQKTRTMKLGQRGEAYQPIKTSSGKTKPTSLETFSSETAKTKTYGLKAKRGLYSQERGYHAKAGGKVDIYDLLKGKKKIGTYGVYGDKAAGMIHTKKFDVFFKRDVTGTSVKVFKKGTTRVVKKYNIPPQQTPFFKTTEKIHQIEYPIKMHNIKQRIDTWFRTKKTPGGQIKVTQKQKLGATSKNILEYYAKKTKNPFIKIKTKLQLMIDKPIKVVTKKEVPFKTDIKGIKEVKEMGRVDVISKSQQIDVASPLKITKKTLGTDRISLSIKEAKIVYVKAKDLKYPPNIIKTTTHGTVPPTKTLTTIEQPILRRSVTSSSRVELSNIIETKFAPGKAIVGAAKKHSNVFARMMISKKGTTPILIHQPQIKTPPIVKVKAAYQLKRVDPTVTFTTGKTIESILRKVPTAGYAIPAYKTDTFTRTAQTPSIALKRMQTPTLSLDVTAITETTALTKTKQATKTTTTTKTTQIQTPTQTPTPVTPITTPTIVVPPLTPIPIIPKIFIPFGSARTIRRKIRRPITKTTTKTTKSYSHTLWGLELKPMKAKSGFIKSVYTGSEIRPRLTGLSGLPKVKKKKKKQKRRPAFKEFTTESEVLIPAVGGFLV